LRPFHPANVEKEIIMSVNMGEKIAKLSSNEQMKVKARAAELIAEENRRKGYRKSSASRPQKTAKPNPTVKS